MMKDLNLSSRSLFIVNKDRKVRQIDGLNCERGLIKLCNVTWMYRQTNTDYCDIDGNKTEILGKYAHK